jgi:hypothetical protein
MKKAILLLSVLGLNMGCEREQKVTLSSVNSIPQQEIVYDTASISVLPFDSTTAWAVGNGKAVFLT